MAQYQLAEGQFFEAMSMGMRPEDDVKPRMKQLKGGGEEQKLSPNGAQTFSAGVVAIREDGSGPDKNMSISVEEYKEYAMGTRLRTDGPTYITPYIIDGGRPQIGISVVCARLVPADTPATPPKLAKQND